MASVIPQQEQFKTPSPQKGGNNNVNNLSRKSTADVEELLRQKIEQTNNKITQLMTNAMQMQVSRQEEKEKPNNESLVQELMLNLSNLANIDFSNFAGNSNLNHLIRATSHLKQAHEQIEMAKKQMKQPEILRLNQ